MSRSVLPQLGMSLPPLNDDEAQLDRLEASWADFLYGLRVARALRDPARPRLALRGLIEIHEELEGLRLQHDGGDRSAIFYAVLLCARENVPMPYWLAEQVRRIGEALYVPGSPGAVQPNLHDLFGMERVLPSSGIRGYKARRDVRLQHELYFAAATIRRRRPGCSVDAAVRQACADLRFPYSIRKARMMFDAQAAIQRRAIGYGSGRVVHRT